jgi:hypothetical protein
MEINLPFSRKCVSFVHQDLSARGRTNEKTGWMAHFKAAHSAEVRACRTLSPHMFPCNKATIHTQFQLLLAVPFFAVIRPAALLNAAPTT